MPIFVGLDLSYVSPGLCLFDSKHKQFDWKHCNFYSYGTYSLPSFKNFNFIQSTDDWINDIDRYKRIVDWINDCLPLHNNIIVTMEGYSMGSKGKVFAIAECGGLVKYNFYTRNIKYNLVSPNNVKKFATGIGKGNKEPMFEAWLKETSFDLKDYIQPKRKLGSPTTDIIDSYWLCKMGYINVMNQ